MRKLILILLLLSATALASKRPTPNSKPQSGGAAVSVNASTWTVDIWTQYMGFLEHRHPTPSVDPFGFDIPVGNSQGDTFAGYFTTPHTSRITGTALVFTFQLDAAVGVTFNANFNGNACYYPGGYPAVVVPYIQRTGSYTPDRDWWARDFRVSLPGAVNQGVLSVTVPLAGANWMNNNGQFGGSAWANTLASPQTVGLSFGGGCYLSHGVNGTGPARFTLISYKFQ